MLGQVVAWASKDLYSGQADRGSSRRDKAGSTKLRGKKRQAVSRRHNGGQEAYEECSLLVPRRDAVDDRKAAKAQKGRPEFSLAGAQSSSPGKAQCDSDPHNHPTKKPAIKIPTSRVRNEFSSLLPPHHFLPPLAQQIAIEAHTQRRRAHPPRLDLPDGKSFALREKVPGQNPLRGEGGNAPP